MSSSDSFDISLKKNNSSNQAIKEDLLKFRHLELKSSESISPAHFQKKFFRKMSNESSKKIIYEPVNEEIVNDSEYKTDESEEEKDKDKKFFKSENDFRFERKIRVIYKGISKKGKLSVFFESTLFSEFP